jgi:cold shock CspA family protein
MFELIYLSWPWLLVYTPIERWAYRADFTRPSATFETPPLSSQMRLAADVLRSRLISMQDSDSAQDNRHSLSLVVFSEACRQTYVSRSVLEGELFFHLSAVQGTTFESLREGQEVEYTEGRGPKGPRAESVTLI